MNMFLHNIGEIDGESRLAQRCLIADAAQTDFDYVLANPPFGKKSSMTITNEEGEEDRDELTYNRQDFWATTSNKQLNFLQHIRSMLKTTGQAAVVLPDNVLFEGGAGETVRRKLLETTDLHTILRLPTGIFYAKGVKANVLFFDNQPARKEAVDAGGVGLRLPHQHPSHAEKEAAALRGFAGFRRLLPPAQPLHARQETWHETEQPGRPLAQICLEQIVARDKTSLDIFWLKDKSLADLDNLPEPDELAGEIIEKSGSRLEQFSGDSQGLGLEAGRGHTA
jgi:type I restriction enzyme M protein